ncbi:MAG: hypothetical protein ABII00_08590 [Elusimicrobiota bacterium]
MLRCLGIFRELTNSPNRETDDALILKAVLDQLGNLGMQTRAIAPEEIDSVDPAAHDAVLPMCESYPRIKRLLGLGPAGPLWVNAPQAVLNCYRMRMIPALSASAAVRFPDSEIRAVEEGPGEPPGRRDAPGGWWIKRGDVHNTCDRDVVHVAAWPEAEGVLRDFARREITHWVVQPHIDGDLVKFYGVGPGHWFTWFYHDPVRARRIPFELDALARQAACGARELGLEVFGGDAIISPGGTITLLDLNSWPSFALVRGEAAVQISWHLQRRLMSASSPRGDAGKTDESAERRP